MRIIFMGTPDFAVESLKALIQNGQDIVAVITAPDRAAGRGKQLRMSAVKQFALEKKLNVLQPEKLKDPDFISAVEALKPDLMVVVAFRMLPKQVWSIPKCGTFNLHGSLLPQYRGAAPINWAIINGETETGVTTFFIDEKIDTGHVIMQEKCAITSNMNAGDLHDNLMVMGAELVVKTVDFIDEGKVEVIPQPTSGALKEAPKLSKDVTRIDWDQSVPLVVNHIRGLSPYPGAWTQLQNGDKTILVKIYGARVFSKIKSAQPGNTKISDGKWLVQCKDGTIELIETQLEGKKRLLASEVIKGFQLTDQACFK